MVDEAEMSGPEKERAREKRTSIKRRVITDLASLVAAYSAVTVYPDNDIVKSCRVEKLHQETMKYVLGRDHTPNQGREHTGLHGILQALIPRTFPVIN